MLTNFLKRTNNKQITWDWCVPFIIFSKYLHFLVCFSVSIPQAPGLLISHQRKQPCFQLCFSLSHLSHSSAGHPSPSLALCPGLLIPILRSLLVLLELTMNYIKRLISLPPCPQKQSKRSNTFSLKSHVLLGDVLPELPPVCYFSFQFLLCWNCSLKSWHSISILVLY